MFCALCCLCLLLFKIPSVRPRPPSGAVTQPQDQLVERGADLRLRVLNRRTQRARRKRIDHDILWPLLCCLCLLLFKIPSVRPRPPSGAVTQPQDQLVERGADLRLRVLNRRTQRARRKRIGHDILWPLLASAEPSAPGRTRR